MLKRLKATLVLVCVFQMYSYSLVAQTSPCQDERFRQFDFWLGDWVVTLDDGTVAGTNQIQLAYGGCVLTEHYQVNNQPFGESLNSYDQATQQWYQHWVDRNGTVLRLKGGIDDGNMVLSGTLPDKEGNTIRHRITWSPNADGTVIQHWQTMQNNKWSTLFRGTYTKRSD